MRDVIPLVVCSIAISGCSTLADATAPASPDARAALIEQDRDWKHSVTSARGCALTEGEFESEHGRVIESINDWFLDKFPDSSAVEEDPIVVLGVVCRKEVNGRLANVVEDRFKTETDNLLRAARQDEAS